MRMTRLAPALAMVLALTACGNSTGPDNPAFITVAQSAQAQLGISPLASANFRLRVPVRVTETAGVDTRINFVRLTLFELGREVERQEITSNALISGLGTNVVRGNTTSTFDLVFDFNNSTFDSFRLDFDFTDENGNDQVATITTLDVVAVNGVLQSLPNFRRFH